MDDPSATPALPGAFEGETLTRRRLIGTSAHVAGAVATAAIVLPAVGFAVGPAFRRLPVSWQSIGPAEDFRDDAFGARVIELATGAGQAGKGTVFVRRRNRRLDSELADRWNQFIAVTSRCSHVGCPVAFERPANAFVCPCHGGVYDLRGLRIGGPPPRPLDRFFTRVRRGQVEVGPRYSVDRNLRRYDPRDPGEPLDGIGRYLYPPRFTTPHLPSR